MRLTLTTKLFALILGVVLLAVASSSTALVAAWSFRGIFETAASENMASVLAAEELEIALLEQKGVVSRYLLDGGNAERLEKLERANEAFNFWLQRARATAHSDDETKLLDRLKEVYDRYRAERDKVVRLFERGEREAATAVLLNEVQDLYRDAFECCELFIDANRSYAGRCCGST